jgi:NADH:ubiquinone oxidoreductase subunit 6 (subunit J)
MMVQTTKEKNMRDSKAYNPPLLFLVGLLTFCLGVIAAIFGAIDKTAAAPGPWLGPILAWTAITALVGTVMAAALQIARGLGDKDAAPPTWLVYVTVLLPIIPGVMIVIACVRLGTAISGTGGLW